MPLDEAGSQLSGYQVMWIMCMFDLPTETSENRRAAARFRHFLLDQGFEMSQFSVYMRFCKGKENYEAYARRIEKNLPPWGNVHLLTFTDRQYEQSRRYCAKERAAQQKKPDQLALF